MLEGINSLINSFANMVITNHIERNRRIDNRSGNGDRSGPPPESDFVIQEKGHNGSKSEVTCRELLEEIFPGEKFPPVKCKSIRHPASNRAIEVDCFNYKLKIAVEYQGIQHYKFSPRYHSTKKDFEDQQKRDLFKKVSLEKHFTFVAVPCEYTHKKRTEMKEFLLTKLAHKLPRGNNRNQNQSQCFII